jgi:NAD(P) transhydrogenase subunit alpha
MDVLSSMSSAAGYEAVLIAARLLPRFFPMMMTAAGTITPARVLVLGAGVAGLQAVATARRLGAVVEAYDVRPVVREQVESLGARFVEVQIDLKDAEDAGGYARAQTEDTQVAIRAGLQDHVKKADVVITTALVPGKEAPLLVTREMMKEMRPGSVIVDLASEQGGNCEVAEPGRDVVFEGVTVAGPLNLSSAVAFHTSEMYSRNISSYFLHLLKDGRLELDLEDELTRGPLVTRDGEVVHDTVRAVSVGGSK